MSYEDRIRSAAEGFAHELDVPGFDAYRPITYEDAPRREAFHRGVEDGTNLGPERMWCRDRTYGNPDDQKAYTVGMYLGLAIYEAN